MHNNKRTLYQFRVVGEGSFPEKYLDFPGNQNWKLTFFPGNIQEIFGNFSRIFSRIFYRKIPNIFKKCLVKSSVFIRNLFEKFPGKYSRNLHRILQDFFRKTLRIISENVQQFSQEISTDLFGNVAEMSPYYSRKVFQLFTQNYLKTFLPRKCLEIFWKNKVPKFQIRHLLFSFLEKTLSLFWLLNYAAYVNLILTV
jgi:hypothetical protein